VVKQGRVVEISVSKGAILDRVPNYVGMTLDSVERSLRAVYASYTPLLRVVDPSYIHADKPEGTILQQAPPPETAISGQTDLHFVVSLGPEGTLVTVGDYVDMEFTEAVASLAEYNFPFIFTLDPAARAGMEGKVVSQSPKAESEVSAGTLIQLWLKPPLYDKEREVFDVFQYEVPTYVVKVPVRLDLESADGTQTLLDMKYHPGGLLSVPYLAGRNDTLVLYVDDREETRAPARKPAQ
jgi:hypothetical protein